MGTYMYLYIAEMDRGDSTTTTMSITEKGVKKPHDLVRSLTVDFFKNSFYLVFKYNMMPSSFCDVTL